MGLDGLSSEDFGRADKECGCDYFLVVECLALWINCHSWVYAALLQISLLLLTLLKNI